jgi:hypothetical protein
MAIVSLNSPSREVPCLILHSVVYRDVTRQAMGLCRLKHVGALKSGLAYLSRCNSDWFCHSPIFNIADLKPYLGEDDELELRTTQMQEGEDDEDIATNDTSTPTPVSTSTTPLGPITRARARQLTHQVSSLLSSGSSYLENGDTCTLILLRNNGLDQKGRGIAQAGFGLQDRHDL